MKEKPHIYKSFLFRKRGNAKETERKIKIALTRQKGNAKIHIVARTENELNKSAPLCLQMKIENLQKVFLTK